MDKEKITALTARIDNMPTLPAIVNQVLVITSDPESTAQQLLEVIEPDQSITVKILKVANSAFYSRAREISTLRQALMIIGFDEVRNLVLSSAVFNNFKKLKKMDGFDPKEFWRHSFTTGLAAKMIAGQLKLQAGSLFVAGLIHDIGKLALLTVLPADFIQTMKMTGNCGLENLTAEKHLLGLTHAEVGMRVLRRWMFPQHFVTAAGFHHDPVHADAQTIYPLVVHLADLLAHTIVLSPDLGDHIITPEGCFSAEAAALARKYGIGWDLASIREQAARLKALVHEQAAVLDAFLA